MRLLERLWQGVLPFLIRQGRLRFREACRCWYTTNSQCEEGMDYTSDDSTEATSLAVSRCATPMPLSPPRPPLVVCSEGGIKRSLQASTSHGASSVDISGEDDISFLGESLWEMLYIEEQLIALYCDSIQYEHEDAHVVVDEFVPLSPPPLTGQCYGVPSRSRRVRG